MPERYFYADPIPGSKLHELSNWLLEVKCSRCRNISRIQVKLLAERHGPDLEIWRVFGRLACSQLRPGGSLQRCHGKPVYIGMLRFHETGKGAKIEREIVIMNDQAKRR